MGSETSRHRRRHTVTADSAPYINSTDFNHHDLNGKPSNHLQIGTNAKSNTISVQKQHVHAYSADYGVNKMIRSASTPHLQSPHIAISAGTIDYNATTLKQNLVTTSASNKPSKKKLSFVDRKFADFYPSQYISDEHILYTISRQE